MRHERRSFPWDVRVAYVIFGVTVGWMLGEWL